MIRIQNVLVATDFSEAAAAALDYGREIARTFGGTLHVLWWDSRNDSCYSRTRPIGNCADQPRLLKVPV